MAMHLRTALRLSASVTFGLVLAPIVVLNVEEVAKKHGADQLLVSSEGSIMPYLTQLVANQNYQFAACVLGGLALGVWLDAIAKHLTAKGPNRTEVIHTLGINLLWLAAQWDHVKGRENWEDTHFTKLLPEVISLVNQLDNLGLRVYAGRKKLLKEMWYENLSLYFRNVGTLLRDGDLKAAKQADKWFMRDVIPKTR